MPVRPLTDLVGNIPLTLTGVGGCRTRPNGYVLIRLKVDEVSGYNEDQIALVVPDNSEFAKRVPLIIGTPTLNRIINVMKESELDKLSTPWAYTRKAVALAQTRSNKVTLNPEITSRVTTTNNKDILDLDEEAVTRETIYIPPLSALHVKLKLKTQLQGYKANVHVSSLDDMSHLKPGIVVEDSYNVLRPGSDVILTCIRNNSGEFVSIEPHQPVARVTLANEEPATLLRREALDNLEYESGYASMSDEEVESADEDVEEECHDLPSRSTQAQPPDTEKTQTTPKLTPEERKANLMSRLDLSGLDKWNKGTAKKAKDLLKEFHDIFSLETLELGETKVAEHEIRLTDEAPFKERFRRIPPPLVDEVRAHLKEMLDAGVIEPSNSPWSNAVVLVRKKDGGLRFCIDFRRLNQRTVQDAYQLPRISEALDLLRGMKCFSCLDLKSGFWQIPMALGSRKYTAFTVGNLGFFECNRMPFGLTNAPATFQRTMERCIGELNLKICLIYLDDLITYSANHEDHLIRLRQVFEKLRECGLKLKPEKCKLFQEEITYLGHRVSADGIRPSEANIEAIKKMEPPTTYTEIRSFVNMVGAYRRFIKGFAQIAGPLYDHLKGENANKKKEQLTLSPDALKAFHALKEAAVTTPVLVPADFTKPFRLETDASKLGLGAVLSQKQDDGKYHPIAYGSTVLKGSQQNYHSGKLEFFALYWAVTKQFKEYLYHCPFTVRTDNNPLTYINSTAKLDATGHRWVTELANYKFNLEYVKGAENVVADCLSRNVTKISHKGVIDTFNYARKSGANERLDLHNPFLVQLRQTIEKEEEIRAMKARPKLSIEVDDWEKAQAEDPYINAFIKWEKSNKDRSLADVMGPDLASTAEGKEYLQRKKNFKLENNLLYHNTVVKVFQGDHQYLEDINKSLTFVVPKEYRSMAIKGCHDDMGHQGRDRTLSLLKERFWWPRMISDMKEKLQDCQRCRIAQGRIKKEPLHPIIATEPLELVHVDYTSIEDEAVDLKKQPSAKNVLVIQDHFTKFLIIRKTEDQTAATTAMYLWQDFFSILGPPKRLISDRGPTFTSGIVTELCKLMGVDKLVTTAYHPEGNGQVERANRTIFNMIRTLGEDQKKCWSQHLPSIQFAYNSTRSAVTGFSPHFLMFNVIPRIPVDFRFPTTRLEQFRKNKTWRKLDEMIAAEWYRLKEAREVAITLSAQEAARQKRYYDMNTAKVALVEGDIVLQQASQYRGKRKTNDRWKGEAYEVIRRIGGEESSLYRIKNEEGEEQTVHRNKLMLIIPKNPVGISLNVNRLDFNFYAEQTTCQDPSPLVTVSKEMQLDTSPQAESTSVQSRLFRYPVTGRMGARIRGTPWVADKLTALDLASGYVGNFVVALELDTG